MFSSGDADECFSRFEICSKANDWNAATKATKLPTLLEGEALAVWLELTEENNEDYSKAKKAIKSKLLPPAFSALNMFNQRTLLPDEALPLFLHDLKRLLSHAMPELPQEARDRLLLHQFLNRLPLAISKQLCSTGDTQELEATVERARLLITISESDHEQKSIASISHNDTEVKERCEVMQLTMQIAELTEQVAALTAKQTPSCFSCNAKDTFSRIVLTNAVTGNQFSIDDVSSVVKRATFKGTVGCREMTRGCPGRATGVPSNRPRQY